MMREQSVGRSGHREEEQEVQDGLLYLSFSLCPLHGHEQNNRAKCSQAHNKTATAVPLCRDLTATERERR